MRPVPPLHPIVVRLLFFAAGYALRFWASEGGKEGSDDEEVVAYRRRRRRRAPPPEEELKLVLVVNEALKMGKGKIGAQCAHAAVGIVEKLVDSSPVLLAQWEECGQPKICLRAEDGVELCALGAAAAGRQLPTYIVHDAGRTQVAAGSRTVLAIGPAPRSAIDKVTGHLKLL